VATPNQPRASRIRHWKGYVPGVFGATRESWKVLLVPGAIVPATLWLARPQTGTTGELTAASATRLADVQVVVPSLRMVTEAATASPATTEDGTVCEMKAAEAGTVGVSSSGISTTIETTTPWVYQSKPVRTWGRRSCW
jgi:hypothetical protein